MKALILLSIFYSFAMVQSSCMMSGGPVVDTTTGSTSPSPNQSGFEVTGDEYLVYESIIKNDKVLAARHLCVGNQTTFGNVAPGSTLEDVKRTLQEVRSIPIDEELVSSYVRSNETAGYLENRLRIRNLKVLDVKLINKEHDCDIRVRFSRAGFTHDMNRALVYIESYSGPKAASGTFVLLYKERGTWTPKKRTGVWTS